MAKFVGTSGSNGITGTSGADEIYARGGDDLIDAGAGNDYIVGGAGGDGIDGGSGFDTVGYSGPASAYTFVRRADLEAQIREIDPSFTDIIYDVYGPDGKDQIQNVENVVFNVDLSLEIIQNGDPIEELCAVTIEENGDITLCETDDTYTGDELANIIFALAGDDNVNGGAGNDIIHPGAGNDVINGSAGFDTISYADFTGAVYVNLDDVPHGGVAVGTALQANGDIDTLTSIEFVIGGSGDDTIYGTTGRNTLQGGPGDDQLIAREGNDTLIGGAGDDYLQGNSGTDTADYSSAVSGIEYTTNTGPRMFDGSDGQDSLIGIERIIGSAFDDLFNADFRNDFFRGGDGADTMNGGGGNDSLFGEAGDDLLNGEDGNDRLYGGDGADIMMGGDGINVMDGGAGNDRIFGGDDDDRIFGRDGDDLVLGGGDFDIINGQGGNDTIDGGDFRDILRGQDGNDSIKGGEGNDRISGGDDVDTAVYDGALADYLIDVRANGIIVVEDIRVGGTDGRDILTEIEFLEFSDGTFDVTGL